MWYNLVTLLIAIPFTVFGMRGGMTTATRPITLSNANQYVDVLWMRVWC